MTRAPRPHLAGLVAAALVAAAGLVGVSSAPAAAAVCSTSGISAVVDAKGAGGGVSTYCNRVTGSKNAAAVFGSVGVSMRRNRDGSVCQVNGLPSNATCQGLGSQYWALFWSNGKDGRWIYSQQGVDSLTIPQNGSVAWAWQSGSGKRQPGAAPPVPRAATAPAPTKAAKPTRSPAPTRAPSTPKPTRAAQPAQPTTPKTTPKATPKGTTKATSAATAKAKAKAKAKASARAGAKAPATSGGKTRSKAGAAAAVPSAEASRSAAASTDDPSSTEEDQSGLTSEQEVDTAFAPAANQDDGLPLWVPGGLLLALGGAAGGTVWWRRRSGTA